MKATRLGVATAALLWAGFAACFALGAWGPGVGVLGAMAVLASTRRPSLPARPDVQRQVEGSPVQGAVVRVTTTAQAPDGGPAGGLLEVDAPVPLGCRLVRERRDVERGRGVVVQEMQAQAVGRLAWPPVQVRITDRWGLAAEERSVEVSSDVVVVPDDRWALMGRRLGMGSPVTKTVRSPVASARALEIERVRPYHAGDPLRDIDWKATSRHQELRIRERERHAPRPVTVLLDCGAGMRVQRHDMKLLSGVRVAYGTLAAAVGASTLSHLVVMQEAACETVAVRGIGEAERALRKVLAACPPLPPAQAASRPSSEAAVLQALGATPGVQVAIVDAERDPEWVVDLLRHLKRRGPVAVVIPATGAHLYRRAEARGPVLKALRQWRRGRRQVQHAAARLRVPCWVLRPGNEADVLARAARLLA